MLTPVQRVILLNVASVLNSEFEKILKRKNVKLCFRITTPKAGITDPNMLTFSFLEDRHTLTPMTLGKSHPPF